MKIEVNVGKWHLFVLLLGVFLISGMWFVFAYTGGIGGVPSVMGHSVDELDWSQTITQAVRIDAGEPGVGVDVSIRGGSAGGPSDARNTALRGDADADVLYLNYDGEYKGGTVIGGKLILDSNAVSGGWDVWIQGGDPAIPDGNPNRNLALAGDTGADRLVINAAGDYGDGVQVQGSRLLVAGNSIVNGDGIIGGDLTSNNNVRSACTWEAVMPGGSRVECPVDKFLAGFHLGSSSGSSEMFCCEL